MPYDQAAEKFDDELQEKFGRWFCRKCADKRKQAQGFERHSQGYYAGTYCDACWKDDGRNHDRPFDSADAGESLDGEHYDYHDDY